MGYWLVFLMTALAGTTAVLIIVYATDLVVRTGSILGVLTGYLLGYTFLMWSRKRKPGTAWSIFMIFFMFIPALLFIFIMTLNKIMSWQLPFGILMLIFAAMLGVIFLASRRVLGQIMTTVPPLDTTNPDERDINALIWAALPGFIIVAGAMLLALIQPWLPYDDMRLWLGVLVIGELSWLACFIYAKRSNKSTAPLSLIGNGMDERRQQHVLWSGLFGFLTLMIMLISSLLQSWVSLADMRLWLGAFAVGVAVWILTYVVLETVK